MFFRQYFNCQLLYEIVSIAANRFYGVAASVPNGPVVKTDIPGPKSKALLKELNELQVRQK